MRRHAFNGKVACPLFSPSHVFGADQPLADPNSAAGKIHKTQPVPNFTRITVQGSVNTPSEWLRLTIDPHTRDVFSWENVVYLP
jgi:hypothetical protein